MTPSAAVWLLVLVWAVAVMGGGALLALLARRIHPSLSLVRLWLFYTVLLGFAATIIMVIVWR